MNAALQRRAARDAAIEAMLPLAAEQGWSLATLRHTAGPHAALLFPGGAVELVEAYIDWANRDMVARADLAGLGMTGRVRALIAARLAWAWPHRAAVRRAVALLAMPGHKLAALRSTRGTVEAIWAAAGDASADFSWYTKRALLAGVYTSTLLFWLNEAHDLPESLAFLDRRLADIGRIGKWRARFSPKKAA